MTREKNNIGIREERKKNNIFFYQYCRISRFKRTFICYDNLYTLMTWHVNKILVYPGKATFYFQKQPNLGVNRYKIAFGYVITSLCREGRQ
jgi:hypothetical protein